MKKILLFSFSVFCFSFANSQCSSVYAIFGSGQPWSIISLDKYDGTYIIRDTIPSLESVEGETSTIEIDSNRYVFLGIDAFSVYHIYTIDFNTGKVLYQPVTSSNLSELHYDVKRKKIYAVKDSAMFSGYQFLLVTLNPYNGSVATLDSIAGMRDLAGETSTLGLDSGTYYVMGLDNIYRQWFYALDEATGHIKYKYLEPANVYALQYDTISKMIYCLSYNSYQIFNSLSPTTGLVTVIGTISGVEDYVGSSSAFAQDSLQYFLGGIGSSSFEESFYTLYAPTGKTLYKPLLGNGSLVYDGSEYAPCNSSYCNTNYSEPICIATIDTATNKAEVIWGRTNSPPATGSYNVYKDTTSGFMLIHNQALNALSEYVDTTSFPSDGPETYELSTLDSCGESALSSPHTTIYLTTTSGLNVYILNWTAYVGFTPSKYRILRGPTMSSLVQIDSVPNGVLTYHDTLPPLGSIYLVEAVNPSSACIPTTKIKPHNVALTALSGSFSNGFNTGNIITGNKNISAVTNLKIYPNPANGMFTVEYTVNIPIAIGSQSSVMQMSVLDELGQVVYDNTETRNAGNYKEQLNLEYLASGIYSLRVQTASGITIKKLVIIRNK